jgi:nucleoside-diphosphate-sugar epimerase
MAKTLIVGCGAIGSELAGVLSAKDHEVTGLKRNPRTSTASNIKYFTANISSPADLVNLDTDFEQAFFIVSPDSRNEKSYRAVYETGLNNLLTKLPDAHWLMVSSTSVYGQTHGEWVDEDSVAQPEHITSRLIRQAEQRLMALNPKNIVVRFSGIYGPGREHLLRMSRQAPEIQQNPPYFTNRIHQRDCVGVLSFLLDQRLAGVPLKQCYLASDDDPAPMWEVMNWLAERLNCQPPTVKAVDDNACMNKRCSNARLKALGYQFQYPSYKDGYLELTGKE